MRILSNFSMSGVVVISTLLLHALVIGFTFQQFPIHLFHYTGSDQASFLDWSQGIAAGDWLSRAQGVFYFSPLYAYLLAVLITITGQSAMVVGVAFNLVTGVAAALLAALIARRLFGTLAGVLAGLLMAANGAQIVWEGMLLNDSLLPSLLLGGLWSVVTLWQEPHAPMANARRWALAGGLFFGLAILARTSNLLPALAMWLALAWRLRSLGRMAWRSILLPMALLLLVCVVLPLVRNGVLFDTWVLTSNGPYNFFIGNHLSASGVFDIDSKLFETEATLKTPSLWSGRLWADIVHDPGHLATILAIKTKIFFNSWDAPDNWNYAFNRTQVAAVRWFTVEPVWFYALGLAGLLATWRRRALLLPVYLMAATFALSIIVVFVSGRYKLPFYGFLAILAGGGLATAWAGIRNGQRQSAWIMTLATVVALPLFMERPPVTLSTPLELFPLRRTEYRNIAVLLRHDLEPEQVVNLLEPFMIQSPVFYKDIAINLILAYIEGDKPRQAVELLELVMGKYLFAPEDRLLLLELRLQALMRYARGAPLRHGLNDLLRVAPDHPLRRSIHPAMLQDVS